MKIITTIFIFLFLSIGAHAFKYSDDQPLHAAYFGYLPAITLKAAGWNNADIRKLIYSVDVAKELFDSTQPRGTYFDWIELACGIVGCELGIVVGDWALGFNKKTINVCRSF